MAGGAGHVTRAAMTAVFVANGLAFGAWAASIPRVRAGAGLSDGTLGVLLLCISLGAVAAMQVAGRYAGNGPGQIGTARACWIAGLLLAAALPGPALAAGWGWLLASGVALGLALGLLDVCMNAHAAGLERSWGRPVMSSFHAGWSVGQLLGAAGMGVAAAAGWGVASSLAAAGLAVAVCGLAALALPVVAEAAPARTGWVRPSRALIILAALVSLSFAIEGGVADWSSVYLSIGLGASAAAASGSIVVYACAMVVMRLVGDGLVRRLGPARVVAGGGAVAGLGLAVVLLAPSVWIATAGFALVGIGIANVVPVLFSAAGARGAAGVSLVATAGYGTSMAGPPLIGFISDGFGLRSGLCVLLAAAVGLVVLGRRVDAARG